MKAIFTTVNGHECSKLRQNLQHLLRHKHFKICTIKSKLPICTGIHTEVLSYMEPWTVTSAYLLNILSWCQMACWTWTRIHSVRDKYYSAYYHVLLTHNLLPVINSMSGETFTFQQDNAPAHWAQDTVECTCSQRGNGHQQNRSTTKSEACYRDELTVKFKRHLKTFLFSTY